MIEDNIVKDIILPYEISLNLLSDNIILIWPINADESRLRPSVYYMYKYTNLGAFR